MVGCAEVNVVTLDLALVVVEKREAFFGEPVEGDGEDRCQRIADASCSIRGAYQRGDIRLREELSDLVSIA